MKMSSQPLTRGCLLATCGLLAATHVASAVAFDSFTDGDFTNNPSGATDDGQEMFWYENAGRSLIVVSDVAAPGGLGTDNALEWNGTGTFVGFAGSFSPDNTESVTLSNLGDRLELSFSMRYTATPAAAGGGFRFGFLNNNGTAASFASQGSTDNDIGYGVSMATTGASAAASSYSRDNGSTGVLTGSGNTSFGAPGSFVFNNTNPHTFTFFVEVSAVAAGVPTELTFGGSYDGNAFATSTQNTNLITVFHEVGFAAGNAQNFRIDDVEVEFVPEPASLSLLGLGAALLLRRRVRC
jgi:hypothetical protein